jgi:hypothetical protein
MKRDISKKMISKAAGMFIAMSCMPAFAQDFDAPGTHTFGLDEKSNPAVDGDWVRTAGGVADLLYGRDFLLGAETRQVNFTSSRLGYIPFAVGPALFSCPDGSCTTAVRYSKSSCTTSSQTHGVSGDTGLIQIPGLVFSFSTTYSQRACSSKESSASKTVTSVASGYKTVPVMAMGYYGATTYYKSSKIFWSPKIRNMSATDSVKWGKVYKVCVSLGAKGIRNWEQARDLVKTFGFCNIASSTVRGRVYGPQPREVIATFPTILKSQSRAVGVWYGTSKW